MNGNVVKIISKIFNIKIRWIESEILFFNLKAVDLTTKYKETEKIKLLNKELFTNKNVLIKNI